MMVMTTRKSKEMEEIKRYGNNFKMMKEQR
jgi:hypothetical protein